MLPGLAGIAGFSGEGAVALTDPNFANTIVLLSGDGTNGSQVFPDESAAGRGNAGFGANASVETLTSKVFGTGSIRFSAITGAWLSYADHADFTLGTSDFTQELFVRFDGNATVQSIASHWGAAGQRGWSFEWRNNIGTPDLRFIGTSDGTTGVSVVAGAFSPTPGTYYYLCAERSGNTFRLYTGSPGGAATMLATATNAISFFNSTAQFRLSGVADSTACVVGNMDEFRFTLGVARYASDAGFTVPTAAFPRS
jgi:hypothetical protein